MRKFRFRKRYSKKQSASPAEATGPAGAVLSRTDSAARRARSAAALARRQMQQQLLCVKEHDSGSGASALVNVEVTRTFPRRQPPRQDRQALIETQERFLTFGRGETSAAERKRYARDHREPIGYLKTKPVLLFAAHRQPASPVARRRKHSCVLSKKANTKTARANRIYPRLLPHPRKTVLPRHYAVWTKEKRTRCLLRSKMPGESLRPLLCPY